MRRPVSCPLVLAALLMQLSCIPGVYDPTAQKPSIGPVEGPRTVAPGGQTRLRAGAIFTTDPIEWRLDPPSAGTFVMESANDPPAPIVQGGPLPTSPAQTSSAIRFTAGSTTGTATFTLTARNGEGPVSTTAAVRIVDGLTLRLQFSQATLGTGVVAQIPVLASVFWAETPGSQGSTAGVPQWLRFEPLGSFGDGAIENLSNGADWSSPSQLRIKAPSLPGLYRLKVTALADPAASATFTLTVQ
ncbi:MAG: hypothetical protein IPL96_01435 [Holophagaceae bacterium]|nr:hypothetical protein [Holophagaceae bacterium]